MAAALQAADPAGVPLRDLPAAVGSCGASADAVVAVARSHHSDQPRRCAVRPGELPGRPLRLQRPEGQPPGCGPSAGVDRRARVAPAAGVQRQSVRLRLGGSWGAARGLLLRRPAGDGALRQDGQRLGEGTCGGLTICAPHGASATPARSPRTCSQAGRWSGGAPARRSTTRAISFRRLPGLRSDCCRRRSSRDGRLQPGGRHSARPDRKRAFQGRTDAAQTTGRRRAPRPQSAGQRSGR